MRRIAIALCLLLAVAVAAYAVSPMAVVGGGVSCTTLDTFAGTNGTDLEAHDTTWVRLTGDVAEIQSSQATIESAGAVYPVYHWNQVAQSADGRVCATATDLGVGTNSYACVNIRLTTNVVSTRGGYSFCAFADNSQLFEFTQAGSFDILDTDLTAVADGSEICIKAQGNTVSGTVDGTTVVSDNISDNNNPVTVAGYIGLELGSDSDGTDIRVDDFKVCDTTVATVSPLFAGDLSQFIQPTHGLRATNATTSLYPWAWQGLVAAYAPGLGNTGDTLRDVSGFHRDGTINGAAWAGSQHGWVLSYDGASDYVDLGTSNAFALSSFTLVVLVNVPAVLDNVNPRILTRRAQQGGNSGDANYLLVIGNADGTFQVNWSSTCGGTFTSNALAGTQDLRNTGWRYLALVWDGTNQIIYVDGQVENSATPSAPCTSGTQELDIGRDPSSPITNDFNGEIGDTRIYNLPLSAAEIQQDFQNFKRRQTYLARR